MKAPKYILGIRDRTLSAAEAGARRAGYELRPQHFYQPFPDVARLPDSLWAGAHPIHGVALNLDSAAGLIREMQPYFSQFAQTDFDFDNGSYAWGDADTLYGLLRHLKPGRVIELGSGASSHVIARARAVNDAEGASMEFESFDPFPGWHEMGAAPDVVTHPVAAEQISPAMLDGLGEGDVLFVDTTHTVKTGGDVTHTVLDLLPSLTPGVYVHFHDIFLPYEYPREWVMEQRRAWAEQYLLQAFLAYNTQFEVVLPVHALWRQESELMRESMPSLARLQGFGPGAFWIRRRKDLTDS
jgi:hypothetical protein